MTGSRTPKAFDYLLEAIASARSDAELMRLYHLGRAHYDGGTRATLEASVDARRGKLPPEQTADSLSWRLRTPFDCMMDEIAAATSVAEIDHLRERARRDFATDPRLPDLEGAVEGIRRVLVTGVGRAAGSTR